MRDVIRPLSERRCYLCNRWLGEETACFDARGNPQTSTKGKWRHEVCGK